MSFQEILMPMTSKNMKPEEFVALTDKQRQNISSVRFAPPKIGSNNFGYIHVQFKTPVLAKIK